ncbi:MAG: RDD family protein [Gammaproteobacteria bacterium]|nr:RDD family protein [Gammaproteobacteria bacterium]
MPTEHRNAPPNSAPLWRRLAAILYDSLIVTALLMVAMALLLPFNRGEAFAAGTIWVQLYLLGVGTGFFVLFWKLAGQTAGMRAWNLRLVHENPECTPGTSALLVRALMAIISWAALGLGFFWCLVDPHRAAWHDRVSKTRLIFTPRG